MIENRLCRLASCAALTALVVAVCSSQAQNTPRGYQPPPQQPSTPRPSEGHPQETNTGDTPHSSGNGAAIAGGIAGAAAAIVITELVLHHDSPGKVAEHGPELPRQLDMSSFAIKGLARAGWPIAVDYVLNGPGTIEVTVTGDHKSQYTCIMRGYAGQRGFHIFNLPENFGANGQAYQSSLPGRVCPERIHPGAPNTGKPQIANYSLAAIPPPGSNAPPPQLRVFGIGVGENAVGSVAIDLLTFQPPAIHPRAKEVATFGFHVHSAFDGVKAGFVFTTLYNGHVLIDQEKGDEETLPPIPEGERGRGTWDGKGKLGEHMLQVRAWRGLQTGGDWVVAWSPDIVDVVQ